MTSNMLTPPSLLPPLPSSDIRPWVRLAARYLDIFIFTFLLAILWTIFSPSHSIKSTFGFGMLAIFLWIFVEAVLLSSIGTTFGKWLLKVKLRDNDGKKLIFSTALKRSFLVWLKGLGMGLPFIYIFTFISEHSDLTKRGATSWDKVYHLKVTHQKIGPLRAITAITLIALLLIMSIMP